MVDSVASYKAGQACFKAFVLSLCLAVTPALAEDKATSQATTAGKTSSKKLDYSGKTQKGEASFYSKKFAGKKMADGTPMDPESNVAASRTLPLGTKAKVTNLDNGKSAVVEIRDRGPYADGRIADVSPQVAKKLDMVEEGVAPVAVTPVELPKPDQKGNGSAEKNGKATRRTQN